MKIKRYDLEQGRGYGSGGASMDEYDLGDWVRVEDVQALLGLPVDTYSETLGESLSAFCAIHSKSEKMRSALELIIRRLQADIDEGSRPDQWSMQALVEKAKEAVTTPTP